MTKALLSLILSVSLLCSPAWAAETLDFLDLQHRAAQGDAAAMTALGETFFDGRGVAKDEVQAAAWFRRAAEKGFAPAQSRLGWMLWKGRGTVRDAAEAEAWLLRAVAQAEPAGQEALSALLAEDKDREKTLNGQALDARFREAADHRTLRSALPAPSLKDRPREEASGGMDEAKWYFRAAEQGVPKALRNLGLMYLSGDGVKRDDAEGFKRILEAAEKKDVVAQWAAGVLLLQGKGTGKDEAQAAAWFRKAADAGDALARRSLGRLHETGRGVPENLKEASRLYRLACDAGEPYACAALGRMHEEGRGAAKKPEEAFALYQKAGDFPPGLVDLGLLLEARGEFLKAHSAFRQASDAGDAAGRYHLGVLFEIGRGGRLDLGEAARLYDGAAFAEIADAQARRARLWEKGLGGKKDEAKAWALYTESAAAGSAPAALAAGLMRWEGRGTTIDNAAAVGFWKPLAEAGDSLAAYWCGRAAEKSGGDAVTFYRTAAEKGHPRAQARLGKLLKEKDPASANAWLLKAAEGGDTASAVLLARVPAKGKEDEALLRAARLGDRTSQAAYARRCLEREDSAGAARWFRMAGVQGDVSAQHALAGMYLAGDGVDLNPAEAVRWLLRASNAGFAPAQRDLGMLYERGLGVPKDGIKAAALYRKAAAGGDDFAKKKLPR